MYNNLIVWARTGQEGSQHAYFPQRGVITAWRDVFSKLSAPNIMEFDLKSFFDKVDLAYVRGVLLASGVATKAEAAFLTKLNRSIPKFPTEIEMEEPDTHLRYTADLQPTPPSPKISEALTPPPPSPQPLTAEELELQALHKLLAQLTAKHDELLAVQTGMGLGMDGKPLPNREPGSLPEGPTPQSAHDI